MDPTTALIAWKIAEPHIKWFTDYMSFKMFGKKFFIEKAVAEAEAQVEANKVLSKWEFELNKEKIEEDYVLALEKAEKEVEFKSLLSVMEKSKKYIKEDAEWNIDPDKMQRLKSLGKEYSSDEMQDYIAKILAWEYNKPWTYSLQTMDIIKTLSKEEIKVFQKFKSIVFNGGYIMSWIFKTHENMKEFWVTFNEFWLLSSLNLIWNTSIWHTLFYIWKQDVSIDYNWKTFILKYTWEKLISNLYSLTRAWKEIIWLLENNYNEFYVKKLKEYYSSIWVQMITYEEYTNSLNSK